jgi:hypothetical protein
VTSGVEQVFCLAAGYDDGASPHPNYFFSASHVACTHRENTTCRMSTEDLTCGTMWSGTVTELPVLESANGRDTEGGDEACGWDWRTTGHE